MTKPYRVCTVGSLTALLLAVVLVAAPIAQAPATWTTPRTAWGDPDLQGIWNTANTGTPMERPTEFGTREFLTEEQIAARVQALIEQPASGGTRRSRGSGSPQTPSRRPGPDRPSRGFSGRSTTGSGSCRTPDP